MPMMRAARLAEGVRHLSSKARLALGVGTAATLALVVVAYAMLPDATLTLVCRHDFRKADLTVSLDGEVVHMAGITGSVSRRWGGLVEKTGGTYTRSIPVPPGKRTIEVKVQSAGYDRTRTIEADLRRGEESVLRIETGRDLALAWREPSAASTPGAAVPAEASPGWLVHAGSILAAVFGSIFSAAIGVFVQDYLRGRKAQAAERKKAEGEGSHVGS